MSQPFPEQVIPGGVLVFPQIRSPGYVAGVSGWAVKIDGSAEFNNLVSRGDFISENGPLTIEMTNGQITVSYNGTEVFTLGAGGIGVTSLYSLGKTAGDNTGLTLLSDAALQGPAIWCQAGSLAATEFIIGPSGDTTGVTDAANINGALAGPAGFPAGGYAVRLMRGTYYVNEPIEMPAYAVLRGAGRPPVTKQGMTVIQAVGALSAVVCSHGWLENTQVTPALGVNISDLQVDGNGTAVRGIVLQTFDSVIENVSVENTTFAGLQFSVLGIGGVVAVAGDAPNNRVISCSFNSTGSYNIRTAESGGSDVFTDGFILDCTLAGAGVAAICVQQAAGWLISGNHLYGLSQHGMQVGGMDNTRIIGNDIETWGSSAAASTYRAIDGWTFPQFGVNGSVISGNSMWCLTAPGNAASSIEGINLAVEAGQSAVFAVVGNTLSFRPSSGFVTANGIVWTNLAATCTLTGTSTGNNVPGHWTNDFITVPDGGTITLTAGV